MLGRAVSTLRFASCRLMATNGAASRTCRVAALQVTCTADKAGNLAICTSLVEEAADGGAKVVFLPEACDYIASGREQTRALAEPRDGATVTAYCALARRCHVWLSLGGVHEIDGERCLNTQLMLSPDGRVAASYSKTHLFDADVPGAAPLRESQLVTPGRELSVPITTPAGRVAMLICYDLRFPEPSQVLRRAGADILTYPSAFTERTGRAHWETLLRARAVETQCYVIAAAQVGKHNEKRSSYGHSMLVDPWGRVLADAAERPNCVVFADIDAGEIERVRTAMPVAQHKRTDLYPEMQPVPRLPSQSTSSVFSTERVFPRTDEVFTFGQVAIQGDMVIHRTELSYAFVNKKCVVPGHVLIAPQRDVIRMHQLTPAEVADLFQLSQLLQQLMERVHGANSSTICIQDGPDAGQTIQHVHVHILPRKPGDFAFNDDIYEALSKHDKGSPKWREDVEMRAECAMLRQELLRLSPNHC